jgi:DNA-nicking Smr family endonuclease
MSNTGRPPNDDERSLWDRFIDGIRPLASRDRNTFPSAKKKFIRDNNYVAPNNTVHVPKPDKIVRNELDRKTLSKLQKGKMAIEGKIDLHNKNQDQAYHALKGFVTRSYVQQKRCVLVVTGKGVNTKSDDDIFTSIRDGVGVLKTRLPEWVSVSPLNEMVLRVEPAHKSHGGGGAFYLYLKRNRPN